MRISGLQPVTLLDYPQKVAAIIFTSGCNMRCPFCYNPNLVLPELIEKSSFLSREDLLDFLERRKKYLDGVVITGGEPTLQPALFDFCRDIKKLGYAIKLDSNGLLPQVLQELIDKKLIDYIAMDIKGPLEKYEQFCGILADPEKIGDSIEMIMASGLDYEFRSTLVKGLHKKTDLEKMAEAVSGAKRYILQNFNRQDCLVGGDFQGQSFSDEEMAEFCRLAQKYVAQCQPRAH